MAYIGRSPVIGSFKKIDDLTSQFNGAQTVFTLLSNGSGVDPGTSQNLLVSLGGVLQEPVTAYTVSGSTITFSSAPANTQSFFAVQLGDALDVGYLTQGVSIDVTNVNAAGIMNVAGDVTLSSNLDVLGYLTVGNNTITMNSTTLIVGNATSNMVLHSAGISMDGVNIINTSGASNNAVHLDGQTAAFYTNASNLNSGTLSLARLDANVLLTTSTTGINASALSIGTVPLGRLSSANSSANGIVDTTTQTFAGNKSFANDVTITGNLNVLGSTTTSILSTNSSALAITANSTVSAALTVNTVTATTFTGALTGTASNATNLNSQPGSYYTNASNISTGSLAYARLATTTAANLLMGNATGGIEGLAMSGDVTISSTGVTAIGSGKVTSAMIADGTIVNGDVSASAAIAVSKLAASTISGVTLGNNLNAVTFNNGGAGAVSGSTYNGSAAVTVSYNTVGAPSTGGSGASGTWGINVTGNSGTVGNLTPAQFFNNMGNNHGTYTDFNNVPGFGFYYVQSTGNGPGYGAQYYGMTLGLGNDYAYSSYAMQFAIPRQPVGATTPYIGIRFREGGTWGSWYKAAAGYADTAGSISGFNNPTTAATGSTIVYRDASGHINGVYGFYSYLNQSGGNSENPSIGQIWTQNTTDNYCRKSTPAHFISQLGLLTTSNYSSYALPLSGGTVSGSMTTTSTLYAYGQGNTGSSAGIAQLNVYATGSNGAIMAFHRGGSFAVNMGLDSDNVFRIGGWSAGANRLQLDMSGNITVPGAKNFEIVHPVDPTKKLRYGAIEGPRIDVIHRGTALVMEGAAQVNLDEYAGLTPGTFAALARDVQCFVTNNESWVRVRGTVSNGILHITAEDATAPAFTVDWLVIGERQDAEILESLVTDETGRLINEYPADNPPWATPDPAIVLLTAPEVTIATSM